MKKPVMTKTLLDFIIKISDDITIRKIDNGFLVEASGTDAEDNWKNVKLACTSRSELDELLNQFEDIDRAD